VQIYLLVVFGAVRDLLLSAKHLFLAAKARRQRAKSGEGSVMARRLSVAGREELERRREFAVGAAVS
jgi:hypothetical protein